MNWLFIALGAVPALALSWALHGWDVSRIEARQAKALTEQAVALQEQCNADKRILEGTINDYQSRNDSINAKLAERLRQPARCIRVSPAKPASRIDAPTKPSDVSGEAGLSDGWLYGFAGDADKDRSKVIGLSDYMRKVWKANQQ